MNIFRRKHKDIQKETKQNAVNEKVRDKNKITLLDLNKQNLKLCKIGKTNEDISWLCVEPWYYHYRENTTTEISESRYSFVDEKYLIACLSYGNTIVSCDISENRLNNERITSDDVVIRPNQLCDKEYALLRAPISRCKKIDVGDIVHMIKIAEPNKLNKVLIGNLANVPPFQYVSHFEKLKMYPEADLWRKITEIYKNESKNGHTVATKYIQDHIEEIRDTIGLDSKIENAKEDALFASLKKYQNAHEKDEWERG